MTRRLRFEQLRIEQLDARGKALANDIIKISRSGIGGPYNAMLRSPVMAERMKHLLDYLRFESSPPRRLNEFAILIQARLWTSQLQWRAHLPLALQDGLSPSVAQDLAEGRRPAGMRPDEEVVYDLCMELSTRHEVSDAIFEKAVSLLGEQQLVDLIAVSGIYVTVAMFLKVSDAQIPAGEPMPLEPLPTA